MFKRFGGGIMPFWPLSLEIEANLAPPPIQEILDLPWPVLHVVLSQKHELHFTVFTANKMTA